MVGTLPTPAPVMAGEPYTYAEPFVGGGAMFFYMRDKYPNMEHAYLSDVNSGLIETYKAIRDKPAALIADLKTIAAEYLNASEEKRLEIYLSARKWYNMDPEPYIFMFLNRTCFNGLWRVNAAGKMNVPHGKYDKPNICNEALINECSAALQGVQLMCSSAVKMHYPRYAGTTYIYMDPPYRDPKVTTSFTQYTPNGFSEPDHVALRDHFLLLDGPGKYLQMSNSFDGGLYAGLTVLPLQSRRSIAAQKSSRGMANEIVVMNSNWGL